MRNPEFEFFKRFTSGLVLGLLSFSAAQAAFQTAAPDLPGKLRHSVGLFGSDDRIVRNGLEAPFRSVGRVFKIQGKYEYLCTGTLIQRDVVLTAAHCLEEGEALYFQTQKTPNLNDTQANQIIKVARIYMAKNYSERSMPDGTRYLRDDFAVLLLEKPTPEEFGSLQIASNVRAGTRGLNVGYPGRQFDSGARVVDPSCQVHALYRDSVLSDCTSFQGNSGGPILIQNSSGTWEIASVASTSYQENFDRFSIGLANQSTNVSIARDEIETAIQIMRASFAASTN